MKKTIITLLALAGAAMAETPLTLLPDLSAGATRHDSIVDGNLGNGGITADSLATTLKGNGGASFLTTGWHWGLDNGDSGFTTDLTIDSSKTGFTIKGRYNYDGEYMLASVNVGELLAGNTDEYVDSITIKFDVTAQNSLTFSAWSWNGTTATEVITKGAPAAATNITKDVVLTSNDTLLFVFGTNAGNGAANTIANLTSSYTTAPVPEPATATLSLLALAGLAARRRRK